MLAIVVLKHYLKTYQHAMNIISVGQESRTIQLSASDSGTDYHKTAVKVLIDQGCNHFKAWLGKDPLPSLLMWLLTGLKSSRNITSLLHEPLQGATLNTSTCFLQSEDREGEGNQIKWVKEGKQENQSQK